MKDLEENETKAVMDAIETSIEYMRRHSKEGGLFTKVVVEDILFGYNDSFLSYLKVLLEAIPYKTVQEYAKSIDPYFGLEVRVHALWYIMHELCMHQLLIHMHILPYSHNNAYI